ncbi:MAG: hypothetical protein IJU53_00330 [Thermoguttaceae bacterium]|nr:hypothetical protein [Thermoguttaceae bacterium]
MNWLLPLKKVWWTVRYSFPIWVDNHTYPPLIRTTKNRLFRSHAARVRSVMRQYEIAFGHSFDLQNPQTFNEKIQWLKLFYPNPLITVCADKYRVREYVAETIGPQYLANLLAVYDRPGEIDFDALPNQFALKVNWGSGQNYICRNKSEISENECRKTLKNWLKPWQNQYFFALEWGYRDIPPKIICEEYLKFLEDNPKVFKIMCFNGEPRVVQLVMDDKTPRETINYYDTQWNLLPFGQNFPTNPEPIAKPVFWEEMLELARKLCKPFPFVRVDFYESPKHIYFSEMTFYSDAGLARFQPEEWDLKLGEMLTLPEPVIEKP